MTDIHKASWSSDTCPKPENQALLCSISCLAKEFSQENLEYLCWELRNKLLKIKISIFSESLITAILFNLIPTNETIFISYDGKISEKINEKVIYYKCDIACIVKNTLFIFESKFRQWCKQQSFDALKCISHRAYVTRILNYSKKWLLYDHKIDNVIEIGVSYQTEPFKVHVSSVCNKIELFDEFLDKYKTREFCSVMKKGRRRFGGSKYFI